MFYKRLKQSKRSHARLGRVTTSHGVIQTPFFMPIATKGAVKSLPIETVKSLGAQIILSNTYHLYLQPGLKVLKRFGGLRGYMNWSGPILTDSGGFQVFSLSKIRKIGLNGVEFRSHIDGSLHQLTPKKVLEIQKVIGSDIAMVLDVCPSSVATRKEVLAAVEATTRWATVARKLQSRVLDSHQHLFGIIQGGLHRDLREQSLHELAALDFDGYAIGGLAVGETPAQMDEVLDYLGPQLPADKPRYLMGVGTPRDIVSAVRSGIDMFDCVIPTREARHGLLYLWKGTGDVTKKDFYETINITNAKYKLDKKSLPNLPEYSFSYLHHLFKTNEPLALTLATQINVGFYLELMKKIRGAIKTGKL